MPFHSMLAENPCDFQASNLGFGLSKSHGITL
jgi:hypothetical protein